MKKKEYPLYFGHPINFYNTPKESELISIIKREFPHFVVENPNQPNHDESYHKWKEEKGNGMAYFYEVVLPRMYAGVFLSFEDGKFGSGVFGEAKVLDNQKKPIYEITTKGIITPMLIDITRVLSIEETKERVHRR
ncbi:MAG: hypothetical protein NTU63_01060 [Candidatus Pacearchaeota archaeon]|nr:hypothetical protein [Candidatus Pacearchaeota archaeon]